ncbi:MAG: hypothetical protein DIU75_014610 [Mycolicibacterium hassiacum]|jgi:hypothetical protein|uniref:hypothetical protein n=1 Tax=Mycolicibacterium hassiacum TaxID=46351 RepID=UPI000DB32306|nr:hypothetical protein [Mycolicibacterium hassiacum]MBX5485394.1 hypothetical protein [Mycolicibacterium hassiacum]PZN15723.1 MAG: hypothetical protein DIU75_20390 [Mycolicibacterium hassiacum]
MREIGLVVLIAEAAAGLLLAAPTVQAAPTSDDRGYVDSTARCAAPNKPVLFGSTANSRVAICETPRGGLEYRGVRIRDGARLIVTATRAGDGTFVAKHDGVTYTVDQDALLIEAGGRVLRTEKMLDVHRPGSTESATAAPTTSASPTTPLPPPLPAESGYRPR